MLATRDVPLEIKFRLSATKFLAKNALGIGSVAHLSVIEREKPNFTKLSEMGLER